MSQRIVGYIDYTAQGGDTFDSIALAAYNEERMASTIIDANRDLCDVLIFEGGEGRADPHRRDCGNARHPAAVEEVSLPRENHLRGDGHPHPASTAATTIRTQTSRATSCCSSSTTPGSCGTRWSPKKGDTIAVEDGAAKTGKMFVESVVPESGLITLRAYSAPQSTKHKRSKSWEKVKFLQLIQEIAGRHGLTVETYGITDQTYDYVEQNNLPDFAFLQARCTLEGAAFLVYDGKLVVYDEAYMEGQQPVETITITPANDFEYRDDRPAPTARPRPSTAAC